MDKEAHVEDLSFLYSWAVWTQNSHTALELKNSELESAKFSQIFLQLF